MRRVHTGCAGACCIGVLAVCTNVTSARCATQLYGPNVAYAGLMEQYGWSEAPLLLLIVPVRRHAQKAAQAGVACAGASHAARLRAQTVVGALVDGIAATLASLASQPGLLRLFPRLAAPPATAALAQWASCGALGGTALRALGSDAINAALPWAPEFCGWAKSVMGASPAEAALPLPAAQSFLATLRSSALRALRT